MTDPTLSDQPDPSAPASQPADAPDPAAAPAPQPPPPQAARAKSPRLMVALVALAVTGMGSLMLVASAMRSPEPHSGGTPPAANRPADAAVLAEAPVAVEPKPDSQDSPVRQQWTTSRNPRKAGYGANQVFELAANEDIDVWRKRVRPVLTVRCAPKAIEVFVVTDSPASIEDNSNRHTIAMSFDGREPIEQKWEHSIDHDALFAPDGRAMIRRIAGAKALTFSFAPFNAPSATVSFSVDGFSAQHKTAARMCGL